ncbi:MAG: UbiA family prenyltransferase [Thermoplasmatota archaeon]
MNKKQNSMIKKAIEFITRWRSLPFYELFSYILMFACVPMFAYGIQPYNYEIIKIIILTILTLYSGFFATLIWNDVTDFDIDAIAHPDRPIPSGRIDKKKFFKIALIFSALNFIFAFLINIWCLFLVAIAAIFVAFHNKYFKRIIKIPAYSEIFGPFQWIVFVIFGFLAIWTASPVDFEISFKFLFFEGIFTNSKAIWQMILLVFFTYFADSSHDIAEGIHDAEADLRHGVKTYATTLGKEKAAKISFIMFIISGVFGVILFFQTLLSPIFLCLFLLLFIYTIFYPIKLLKTNNKEIEKIGSIVGRKLYDYFLFTYDIIFLDLIIQILIFNI